MRRKVLIAGLGNPGKQYQNTKHNVGFCVIDELAQLLRCSLSYKSAFHADIGQHLFEKGTYILAKPMQYMNNSGIAISALCQWYTITESDNCIIIADNTDLPVGTLRFKRSNPSKGSTGTHNGIKSVRAHLKNQAFITLYVGIGSARPKQSLSSYVLSNRHESEKIEYANAFTIASRVLTQVFDYNFEALANVLACEQRAITS